MERITMFRTCILIAAAVLALNGTAAFSQSYPTKQIRMILPFPPGSPSDIVGRAVAQKVSEQLGVAIIADNRAGAGGNLGTALAAKAPPDGYTIMTTSPSIALSPSLYQHTGYDAKDLAPIARLAAIENVVLVHPSVPAKTLRQFVELARKQPGKLSYGSGGAGTTNHLANELLKTLEKIDILHVPYKGATVAAVSLMGGEVDQVIVSVASAMPYIRTGRVRPIAVLSEKRVGPLPDVPTSKESGMPQFTMSIWYGMRAQARTPNDIITRLYQECAKALQAADLRERFAAAGVDPWLGTPEEFDRLIKSETARYARIAEKAGLKKE
jgi:tripartite-type tricarboxylate transporter receptor subunit TctC